MSQGNSPIKDSKESIAISVTEDLPRDSSQLSLTSNTSQEEQFKCWGHAEASLKKMQSYLQEKMLCDVTLIAGNDKRRVSAHRLVLSAASEYFAAMFLGSLKESHEEEITLGNVDGDALFTLVQYCYTGRIELREDTVETLLVTACLLQLGDVAEACCNFLAKQLHPSNCLGIAFFAEQHACPRLFKRATAYINQHFMLVYQNQEFMQLTSDQLATLLSSDDLNVTSEEDVYNALIAWAKQEPDIREPQFAKLLAYVRLPLLQPAFIADNVELVCRHTGGACQILMVEALKWHLLPERRRRLSTSRTRPRKSTIGKLLAIGGMDACKGATSIEVYCPLQNSWKIFGQMGGRRLQFGVAIVDDKLLVVGGRDGLKTLNSVESLDLNSMTWSVQAPMGTHRHGLGVAVLEGPLYAVGGHDGWSYLNSVERWDPVARTWSYVAPMSFQRNTAGVAVLNGRLYAVGGRDGSTCLRTVECYDPHTNKWTARAPMIKQRGGVGVGVVHGFMYALGGHDLPASNPSACRYECVERYDPSTDTWMFVANLSGYRDSIGVCLLGDRLMAVGGYDGSQYLTAVEEYDTHNNEWNRVADLNTGRAGASVVAIKNKVVPS